jgi:hypothetical protein
MGGFGSGRPQTRAYYDTLPRLEVKALRRLLAHPGKRVEVGAAFAIEIEEAALVLQLGELRERIAIERQPRHFGGAQPYLACPRCGRRAMVLRQIRTGLYCRHCLRAHYRVQSEDTEQRATRAYRKACRKLARTATADDIPPRPRRMRLATYARLEAEALAAWERREAAFGDRALLVLAKVLGMTPP